MLKIYGNSVLYRIGSLYIEKVGNNASPFSHIIKGVLIFIGLGLANASLSLKERKTEWFFPLKKPESIDFFMFTLGITGIVLSFLCYRRINSKRAPVNFDRFTSELAPFILPSHRPNPVEIEREIRAKIDHLCKKITSQMPIKGIELINLKRALTSVAPIRLRVVRIKKEVDLCLNSLEKGYLEEIGRLQGMKDKLDRETEKNKRAQESVLNPYQVLYEEEPMIQSGKLGCRLVSLSSQQKLLKETIEHLESIFIDYNPKNYWQGMVDLYDLLNYLVAKFEDFLLLHQSYELAIKGEEEKRSVIRIKRVQFDRNRLLSIETAKRTVELFHQDPSLFLNEWSKKRIRTIESELLSQIPNEDQRGYCGELTNLFYLLINEIRPCDAFDTPSKLIYDLLFESAKIENQKQVHLVDILKMIRKECCHSLEKEMSVEYSNQNYIQYYLSILLYIGKIDPSIRLKQIDLESKILFGQTNYFAREILEILVSSGV